MVDRDEILEDLVDHYQNPRNHGEMPDADVQLQGGHSGCADVVTVYLKLEDHKIADISFVGQGCTISQAATSMLTEVVKGLSTSEIEQMDYGIISDLIGDELVKTRPRCATLGLDTIKAAVQDYQKAERRGS
jgi:nitrogen fixation protein NifU and related proteins